MHGPHPSAHWLQVHAAAQPLSGPGVAACRQHPGPLPGALGWGGKELQGAAAAPPAAGGCKEVRPPRCLFAHGENSGSDNRKRTPGCLQREHARFFTVEASTAGVDSSTQALTAKPTKTLCQWRRASRGPRRLAQGAGPWGPSHAQTHAGTGAPTVWATVLHCYSVPVCVWPTEWH